MLESTEQHWGYKACLIGGTQNQLAQEPVRKDLDVLGG